MITFKIDDPTYGKAVSEGKKNFIVRQGQYIHVIFDAVKTMLSIGGSGMAEGQEEEITEEVVQAEKIEMLSPGTPSYAILVSAIVRYKYTQDAVEAIQLNGNAAELTELDAWRNHAKSIAADILAISATIEGAKDKVLRDIVQYDKSEAVNSFEFGGKRMWLDKATRVGLMNSVTIEKTSGKADTTLWFGGEPYVIEVDKAIAMLSALEIYALACYNVTEQHKARVNELTDIEAVLAYDYTVGYPDKLSF